MFRLNPITRQKLNRFKAIRRGYWSFLILVFLYIITFFGIGEYVVNSRALLVKYEGSLYFPTHGRFHPGTDFGEDYPYETKYRDLKAKFKAEDKGNFVVMPPIPYNPYENNFREGEYGPQPPNWGRRHLLGTDNTGRDIFARLFYGFRYAMTFALALMASVYVISVIIGCAMGYFGGWFDLIPQRIIEIWQNLPFLYMVIIISSIITPNIWVLLGIFILFSWMGMTYYMRTETYREKARDYVASARVLGASNSRVIFIHILPNAISTLVTFLPFTIASSISALTSLDFLGLGLPPPTPSWGELLKRGVSNLNAPWIVSSAFGGLVFVLVLVTFVGEAIREAFDPKKYTVYR
ncbi:MAG: ABC transporter permease subunit [Verrucomicrobiota bacterium]